MEDLASRSVALTRESDHWAARFMAMASPCEVLIETPDELLARSIANTVAECAWRIEQKFSRYRTDNIVYAINRGAGKAIAVDEETANLIDFAATLTNLSNGRFDITSGVLRKVWTFDGSDRVPSQRQIDELLPLIGWHKVRWSRPILTLAPGMQIDFGGIGKEYAVDAAVTLAEKLAPGVSCLVNFGGDVALRNARSDTKAWRVGVERHDHAGDAVRIVQLNRGGLATSGDSRRFLLRDGHRYSHILDARSGWPVENAPHSVTVAADTCTQAGTLTTLAMLQGEGAAAFLKSTGAPHWIQ